MPRFIKRIVRLIPIAFCFVTILSSHSQSTSGGGSTQNTSGGSSGSGSSFNPTNFTAYGTLTLTNNAATMGSLIFGTDVINVGYQNTVTGAANDGTISVGSYNLSSGVDATTFGIGNIATNIDSYAFGGYNEARARGSTAFGYGSKTSGQDSSAFGRNAVTGPNALYGLALGHFATTSNQFAVAIGHQAMSTNNGSMVLTDGNANNWFYSQADNELSAHFSTARYELGGGAFNLAAKLAIAPTTSLTPLAFVHTVSTNVASDVNFMADSYGAANVTSFVGRRARGTFALPTATQVDDALFLVSGRGYGTTGFSSGGKANVSGNASQAWTDTAQGTYLRFSTTSNNFSNLAEQMRLDNTGNLGIGTTTPVSKLDVRGTLTASSGIITNLVNVGNATNLIQQVSGQVASIKGLSPGANITLTDNGTNISIAATSGGNAAVTNSPNYFTTASINTFNAPTYFNGIITNGALVVNTNGLTVRFGGRFMQMTAANDWALFYPTSDRIMLDSTGDIYDGTASQKVSVRVVLRTLNDAAGVTAIDYNSGLILGANSSSTITANGATMAIPNGLNIGSSILNLPVLSTTLITNLGAGLYTSGSINAGTSVTAPSVATTTVDGQGYVDSGVNTNLNLIANSGNGLIISKGKMQLLNTSPSGGSAVNTIYTNGNQRTYISVSASFPAASGAYVWSCNGVGGSVTNTDDIKIITAVTTNTVSSIIQPNDFYMISNFTGTAPTVIKWNEKRL